MRTKVSQDDADVREEEKICQKRKSRSMSAIFTAGEAVCTGQGRVAYAGKTEAL